MTNVSNERTESNTSTDFPRPSWDQVWMSVADTIGSRSRCTRAQVGCVVVDKNQSVLAASYNGPPPSMEVDGNCKHWCDRARTGDTTSYDNCPANHAEINAITRMPSTQGATVYINRMCCFTCAKALASAGVKRIVYKETNLDAHLNRKAILDFLWNCGVTVSYAE